MAILAGFLFTLIDGGVKAFHQLKAAVLVQTALQLKVGLPRRSGRSYWGKIQTMIVFFIPYHPPVDL